MTYYLFHQRLFIFSHPVMSWFLYFFFFFCYLTITGEDALADVVDASDINSVAGVLKLYFRELREPLFPLHLFDALVECTSMFLSYMYIFFSRMYNFLSIIFVFSRMYKYAPFIVLFCGVFFLGGGGRICKYVPLKFKLFYLISLF